MTLESVDSSENIKKLLKLKPNEDVWAAVKCDLFKTYSDYDRAKYFGHWEKPFRDTSYSINCIEGASPKVYKAKKLIYLGMFEAQGTFDKVFVFSDGSDRHLRFSSYILLYDGDMQRFNSYGPLKISSDAFSFFDRARQLDYELIAFNEEDCLKICRELNGRWRNDLRYIDFKEKGLYIKKTLKSMMRQLDDFMHSEHMVDPATEVKKDLNGRPCSDYDAIDWLGEDIDEDHRDSDKEDEDDDC